MIFTAKMRADCQTYVVRFVVRIDADSTDGSVEIVMEMILTIDGKVIICSSSSSNMKREHEQG